MVIGSFCVTKNNKLTTLQPKILRISGTQKGFIQCLEIYQSITSEEDLDQVSYIFPTDNNLCIYNMKFQVGDETITAELRSKEAAKETFEEAKKIGRTAAMAEEVAPGITSVKIGNVPKDKTVAIIFNCSFASTLSNPTTILTKIPLQASEPDGSITDLYDLPSLEIDLDINISQLQPISDVYTNSESQYTKTDEYNGKLTIKSAVFTDENILIMTELQSPIQSQMVQTYNSTAISVIPDFKSASNPSKEYVFLIDCSASMIGESLKKAKESLHIFLTKLPPDSYFNIIRFGTKFDKLFEYSEKVQKSTIEKASTYVDQMKANLGGTEMLSMLDDLFTSQVKIGDQRQIFLVTDGEVYERQKVIQKVEENNGFNRIFAIGLGHGADAGFLDEIATLTNGKSDFVFNAGELPTKVAEHFDLSLQEASVGTEIHAENSESFEAVPYPLPPLLSGTVRHFFVSTHEKFEGVMIVGHLKDGSQVENIVSLASNLDCNGEKSPVFALFAQKQLKKIEQENNDENDNANNEKLIKLSIESGVMCKKTSYIAVSENSYVNETRNESAHESGYEVDRFECDDVADACAPVEMCCCSFARAMPEMMMMDCCKIGAAPMRDFDEECCKCECECEPVEKHEFFHHKMKKKKGAGGGGVHRRSRLEDSPPPTESDRKEKDDDVVEIIDVVDVKNKPEPAWKSEASFLDIVRIQSRDGFWDLHSSFVCEKSDGKLPDIGVDLSESPIVLKRVTSTVFTLAYLEKFFSDAAGKWKFAREKGFRWLKRINGDVNWELIIKNAIPSITK